MSRITDYGNIKIGDNTTIDVPIEKDIFGKIIESKSEICEITNIVATGKSSVWITFQSESGKIFSQLKRITTKVLIYN
jgi:hypothetical protein